MTLRKKTLLITTVTIACLMVGLYFLSSAILLQGFSDVEAESVRESIDHVEYTLQNEMTTLGNITRDWAGWDDTYAFIEDHNEEYVESNLMLDSSFVNNRVNLMVFVNSAGETVYSKGFDLLEEKTAPVPENMQQYLAPGSLLLQKPDAMNGISGIIMLPEGPMLFASEPILTSEREPPARGSLIWGRFLNDAEVEHLAQLAGLNLAIYRLDDAGLPADIEDARTMLKGGATYIKPFSNDMIAGYKELNDITGNPSLILRTEQPRPVYAQGQATIRYLLIAILGVGMVLGAVTLLLLERLVLSRIAHLRREVRSIGVSGNHAGRVHINGKDELADFTRVINAALDALEK
ncbi:MAG: CHASE4 domain-containing protein [Actinomycetota bacterium]